jgi:putative salt-induced outer membrane protein
MEKSEMRRFLRLAVSLALLLFVPLPLFAQGVPPSKGSLEFSYLDTSGNTDSQSLLLAGKGEQEWENSKLEGEVKALYGKKNGVASDKSWMFRLKYDENITELTYSFISQVVERDVLKGIEIRYISMLGLGHYFLKNTTDTFKGEVSAGYTRENPVAPFPDRGFPVARLFGGYVHTFAEKTRFEQTVEYLPSLKEVEDYLLNEESAFITSLVGNLAFKISYAIFYDNLPPPTFHKTDRLFKTSLLMTF